MSPGSSPATLRSLQDYVPGQTELIDSLLNTLPLNSHFKDPSKQAWRRLWSSVWDKNPDSLETTEAVKRGPDPVDDSLIPDVVPSHCDVMLKPESLDECWRFRCKKIFVRSEYKEAEEFVLSTCATPMVYDAMIITGQPGVGKSVFLLRILLRRLALGLPTALQIKSESALLFHQGGVGEFTELDDGSTYTSLESKNGPLGRIWALVDSNHNLREPASIFKDGPFFVVQTASPHPARQEWTRRVRTEWLYMGPWSFSEVLQVRFLVESVPPSEKGLWYLHFTYGASPGNLFLFADRPHRYDKVVISEINKLSPSDFTKLVRSVDNATDGSHYLISTGPLSSDRTMSERKVASSYILGECCKKIFGDRVEEIKKLYDTLRNEPTTSTTARMIFQYQAHQFLQMGRVLEFLPLLGRNSPEGEGIIYEDYASRNPKHASLPKLKERVVTDETGTRLGYDTYYRPQSNSFPTIDSWVLVQHHPHDTPTFLTFQITTDMEQHEVKRSGLDKVDKLDIPFGARRYLVVLTPTGVKPKVTVPMDYLTDKFSRGYGVDMASKFLVFHYQVDNNVLFGPRTS